MCVVMKNVTVLLGGFGKEREVSLNSGNATLNALNELGFSTSTIDLPNDLNELIAQLETIKPDVVFNCLHGPIGEDGTVQEILNALKIPYTHSGVTASTHAMDKWKSYQIFKENKIPTPETLKINLTNTLECPLAYPCVAKPINEGSSVGIHVISSDDEWKQLRQEWVFGCECLVQEYLKQREIHVAVLDGVALGTIEICPKETFSIFSYQAKYVPGEAQFICPAPISKVEEDLAKETALKTYQALGCRGLSRIDMMFDGSAFSVLELNTQPGFTTTSLAPQIAKSQGLPFIDLVGRMVASAKCD